jgi:hypothetical protein
MKESWSFNCPSGVRDIETLLQRIVETQGREMEIFLSYYFKPEGAVVEGVQLLHPPQRINEWKGSVQVGFSLVHFNACLNIHEEGTEKMELQYSYDPDSRQLTLSGPDWPEREPDEI